MRKKHITNELFTPLGLGVLFLFAGVVFSQSPAPTGEYTGMEECQSCHEDLTATFRNSIHGKKGFDPISGKACETCHGPGSEHIANGGDISKIGSFSKLPAAERNAACLDCHEQGAIMHFAGSVHDAKAVSCTDCHRIHMAKPANHLLKAADEIALCLTCHHQERSNLMKSSHHPMREGKMTCSDCHNAHGSLTDKLVASDSINDKCYACHAEKRGPFLFEHAPVIEDCTNCHDPHGSNHPRLLKARASFLCQRCHSEPRHPGTLYDQPTLGTRAIYNRACLNCHATIHGSNHPSGQTFLR